MRSHPRFKPIAAHAKRAKSKILGESLQAGQCRYCGKLTTRTVWVQTEGRQYPNEYPFRWVYSCNEHADEVEMIVALEVTA